MTILPGGVDSVISISPWPTFLSPAHAYVAPLPAVTLPYVRCIAGSRRSYGDQAVHRRNSLTRSKMRSGGASMEVARWTRNEFGLLAANASRPPMASAATTPMVLSMSSSSGASRARATAFARCAGLISSAATDRLSRPTAIRMAARDGERARAAVRARSVERDGSVLVNDLPLAPDLAVAGAARKPRVRRGGARLREAPRP